MFNPLVDDFSLLKDSEVEEKLFDLKRKYWQRETLPSKNKFQLS